MEVEGSGGVVKPFEDPLPHEQAPVPLELDDDTMDENDDLNDFVEDIERVRSNTAARTLYHQPRTDADTVCVFIYGWLASEENANAEPKELNAEPPFF